MTSKITIKDLKNDLLRCQKLGEPRLLILFLDLYMEHFIHALYGKVEDKHISLARRILKNFLKHEKIVSVKTKAKNLAEWNELNKEPELNRGCLEVYLLIHKLRNELVHHLRPNTEKVEKWINNHEPIMDDPRGLVTKFFEKKANPWDKIQIYAFPAITHFYQRLEEASGKRADYTINFEITPQANAMRINIIPKQAL